MAKFRPLPSKTDVRKSFATEDGTHYRHYKQDLAPAVKHARYLADKVNEAPKSGNKGGWGYVGSIPMVVLVDWLTKHGYTFDQWARNDGGNGNAHVGNYKSDPGVKAQFLRYFLSRDYAKLHAQHITTKKESTVHQVPASIQRQAVDIKLG